jgi:hypothetical protein
MAHRFTLDEARAALPRVQEVADQIIEVRASLVAQQARHQQGDESVMLADLKADEARLADLLDGLQREGIEVKGWAPILVDFPSQLDGHDTLLCWLEGESELGWYHDPAHGFAGRRRLPPQR